jgi:hypothetical protein
LDDRWSLSRILTQQALVAAIAGDSLAARAAAEEGRNLADSIGDRYNSRQCRIWLAAAQVMQGNVAEAITQYGEVAVDAEAAHDETCRVLSLDRGLSGGLRDPRGRGRAWREVRDIGIRGLGIGGPGRRGSGSGA